ncbi:histone-like nucleoid-structuring protein Lsr2 [Mycolicibacterium sphagni]|uniref:Lsr2 family protein n=1 Tax=Mycolicibacterium sphagni TaxID=1786 RepID=A0A255DQW8_9MYCO|nr:Lsr2 family protein [Mycolicibacterium sphagni]OYN81798.1 hypothetical protein CG716_05505 [Mycolicibacterium sphagni]
MGKRVTVTLFDDLEPEVEATTEREWTVDGIGYHLDLSEKNAKAFDKDQAKWTEKATRVGRATTTRAKRGGRATHSGGEEGLPLGDIRTWAQANGHDVADRGRVSAEVVRAWKAAGSPVGEAAKKAAGAPAKKAAAPTAKEPAKVES